MPVGRRSTSKSFQDRVIVAALKIPFGRVTSYGHLALLCGHPSAARAVGAALSRLPANAHVPWHRVINAKGLLSIRGQWMTKEDQAARLRAEGVEVSDAFTVDLAAYGWFDVE